MPIVSFSEIPQKLALNKSLQDLSPKRFVQAQSHWNKWDILLKLLFWMSQCSFLCQKSAISFYYHIFYMCHLYTYPHTSINTHSHAHLFTYLRLALWIWICSAISCSLHCFQLRPVYEDTTTPVPCFRINILSYLLKFSEAMLGVKLTKVLSPSCSKHCHVLYVWWIKRMLPT